MRKPNNTGKSGSKGDKKEGGKSFRKPAGAKPFGDRSRTGSDSASERKPRTGGFDDKPRRGSDSREHPASGRKPKPYSLDDKPAKRFEGTDARPAYKKRGSDEKPPSGRKPKPRNFEDKPRRSFDNKDEKPAFRKSARSEDSFGVDKFAGRSAKPRSFEDKPRRNFGSSEERTAFNKDARNAEPGSKPRRAGGAERKPNEKFDSNARKYGSAKFSDQACLSVKHGYANETMKPSKG